MGIASTTTGMRTPYQALPSAKSGSDVSTNVVRTVNVAINHPTRSDPPSPRKILAGGTLWTRNPRSPPQSRARRGEPLAVDDRRGEEDRRGDRGHAAGEAVHVVEEVDQQIITTHTTVNTAEVAVPIGP